MQVAALVDIVVVSYNSRSYLCESIVSLTGLADVNVIVVDNASPDGSLESISGLRVTAIQRDENRGFAAGCNDGWNAGEAPYVLFLNPDASIDEHSLRVLVEVLERNSSVGLVAPRIERADGTLAWSQRRFPRVRTTFARALFVHRLLPLARWADELVRDTAAYGEPGSPEWVSGACVLVRRTALEKIAGWDDGFFLYGEDIDLCRRLREQGYDLRYEPSARAVHLEGRSAPRSETLPLLAESRVRYNRKHRGRVSGLADRLGMALGALTHAVVCRGGRSMRAGHVRALRVVLLGARAPMREAGG